MTTTSYADRARTFLASRSPTALDREKSEESELSPGLMSPPTGCGGVRCP